MAALKEQEARAERRRLAMEARKLEEQRRLKEAEERRLQKKKEKALRLAAERKAAEERAEAERAAEAEREAERRQAERAAAARAAAKAARNAARASKEVARAVAAIAPPSPPLALSESELDDPLSEERVTNSMLLTPSVDDSLSQTIADVAAGRAGVVREPRASPMGSARALARAERELERETAAAAAAISPPTPRRGRGRGRGGGPGSRGGRGRRPSTGLERTVAGMDVPGSPPRPSPRPVGRPPLTKTVPVGRGRRPVGRPPVGRPLMPTARQEFKLPPGPEDDDLDDGHRAELDDQGSSDDDHYQKENGKPVIMVLPPVVQTFEGAQQTRAMDLDTRWGTVRVNVVPKRRERDGTLRELAKTTRKRVGLGPSRQLLEPVYVNDDIKYIKLAAAAAAPVPPAPPAVPPTQPEPPAAAAAPPAPAPAPPRQVITVVRQSAAAGGPAVTTAGGPTGTSRVIVVQPAGRKKPTVERRRVERRTVEVEDGVIKTSKQQEMSILERLQYQQRTAAPSAGGGGARASIFDPAPVPAAGGGRGAGRGAGRGGTRQPPTALPRFVSLEDDLQASSSDSDEASQTAAQKQQKSDLDMLALICESESKQAPPSGQTAAADTGELASAGGDVMVVPSSGDPENQQQLTVGAGGDGDVAVTEEVVGACSWGGATRRVG
ncbi:hypothetical protein FJT64_002942 [Amphibalanus amphitrite]|uniref:Uncharacterized protein n=1 Tax=Amphibalanus amphitrite TaxID=1232801 RepID=A0A6A4W497_AMPAM|nr:hypothetical protein FJT64_002942 [Amphibalanus amphitrite]